MYRIVSEWDIGHEHIVFNNAEDALTWAAEALLDCGLDEGLEHYRREHLVSLEKLEVK